MRRTAFRIAAAAAIACAALTGCAGGTTSGSAIAETLQKSASTNPGAAENVAGTVTIAGGMVIEGGTDNYTVSGSTCSGTNGYNDLTEGGPVTVTVGNGDIVGQGFLDAGVVDATGCALTYTIKGLPMGKDLYLVEVTHRGKIAATKMDDHDYISAVTIGGN